MQGNGIDFKSGCSVHIEYTPKDVAELREVLSMLKQYQGVTGNIQVHKPGTGNGNGNGNGNGKRSVLSKETLDDLFSLAKERGVYLKKLARDVCGCEINQLCGGDARQLKAELLAC